MENEKEPRGKDTRQIACKLIPALKGWKFDSRRMGKIDEQLNK